MVEFRKCITNLDKTSYAQEKGAQIDTSGFLDCSNGINPFGMSQQVQSAFLDFDIKELNSYPKPAVRLKQVIKEYWDEICVVDEKQIMLGDGSIELIYKVNKLFIDDSSKVLGYSPQFSDFVDDVKANGGRYESYILNGSNNFRMNPEEFINMMNKDHSLFYIDNPNNPTGQVIDIENLEKMVAYASELGRPIVIDEAYGDFISKDNSAITLVDKYENLIVIRSLSKGLGLAGLRAGYMITSKEVSHQYNKVSNPYEMNSIARHLAEAALKDCQFMKECSKKITMLKKRFTESLSELVVIQTDKSVPIMTLMHPDKDVDLENLLMKHEIISVSCRGFVGLGQNFVRLMIHADIDDLIDRFKKIEKEVKYTC